MKNPPRPSSQAEAGRGEPSGLSESSVEYGGLAGRRDRSSAPPPTTLDSDECRPGDRRRETVPRGWMSRPPFMTIPSGPRSKRHEGFASATPRSGPWKLGDWRGLRWCSPSLVRSWLRVGGRELRVADFEWPYTAGARVGRILSHGLPTLFKALLTKRGAGERRAHRRGCPSAEWSRTQRAPEGSRTLAWRSSWGKKPGGPWWGSCVAVRDDDSGSATTPWHRQGHAGPPVRGPRGRTSRIPQGIPKGRRSQSRGGPRAEKYPLRSTDNIPTQGKATDSHGLGWIQTGNTGGAAPCRRREDTEGSFALGTRDSGGGSSIRFADTSWARFWRLGPATAGEGPVFPRLPVPTRRRRASGRGLRLLGGHRSSKLAAAICGAHQGTSSEASRLRERPLLRPRALEEPESRAGGEVDNLGVTFPCAAMRRSPLPRKDEATMRLSARFGTMFFAQTRWPAFREESVEPARR